MAKSINFKIFTNQFKKRYNLLFLAAIVALLVAEFFVVKGPLGTIFFNKDLGLQIKTDPRVRVDFTDYDKDIKRIDFGSSFVPSGGVGANPFQ